jgi:hypothetical protein
VAVVAQAIGVGARGPAGWHHGNLIKIITRFAAFSAIYPHANRQQSAAGQDKQ